MQSVTTALWQSSETMAKTSVEQISCHAVCDDSIMTIVWDYGQNIRRTDFLSYSLWRQHYDSRLRLWPKYPSSQQLNIAVDK